MKRTITSLLAALLLTLIPVMPLSGTALAACGNGSRAKDQVLQGINEAGSNCNDNGVLNVIHGAVIILSIVVG
jgi:hypothetical protein